MFTLGENLVREVRNANTLPSTYYNSSHKYVFSIRRIVISAFLLQQISQNVAKIHDILNASAIFDDKHVISEKTE